MNDALLRVIFDERLVKVGSRYLFEGRELQFEKGTLRFTPDVSYSSGNFSLLREKHAKLQLDSANGTADRHTTILSRTNWPQEYFKDKLVLECGCGAGADTEVLLKLGAQVVSVDLAGTDICRSNVGDHPNWTLIQADIADLPFKKEAFDIVFCHRVLQHTPCPAEVLDHILTFVRRNGDVFVHSYSRTLKQVLSWKYALRPVTRRMNAERLYRLVVLWVPPLFHFTNFLRRIPPRRVGAFLFKVAYHLVPIRNYRFAPQFADKSDDYMIEYGVHDTFDCLSPRYDSPVSVRTFKRVAGRHPLKNYEVVECGVTLLRTIPEGR